MTSHSTPGCPTQVATGMDVPDFLRVVDAGEQPACDRAVTEQAVLALNSSMLRLYVESLGRFKRNIRDRVPIILARFGGAGGQMIRYGPGHEPRGDSGEFLHRPSPPLPAPGWRLTHSGGGEASESSPVDDTAAPLRQCLALDPPVLSAVKAPEFFINLSRTDTALVSVREGSTALPGRILPR